MGLDNLIGNRSIALVWFRDVPTTLRALSVFELYIINDNAKFSREMRKIQVIDLIEYIIQQATIRSDDSRFSAIRDFYRKYFGRDPPIYVGDGIIQQKS